MRNCFDATSKVGCGSIALPLIGTGNLGFPLDVAVQVMVDEALSYSKTFPNSPIEEFRFIVHHKDQEGISSFEDKFKHFKEDPKRTFPLWPTEWEEKEDTSFVRVRVCQSSYR